MLSSKSDLDQLHELYTKGKLVPIIGAGFSKPFGMPSWSELLYKILDRVSFSNDHYSSVCKDKINNGKFFKAIEMIEDDGNKNENDIKLMVADIIKKIRRSLDVNVDNNYIDIATLNFNTILTTNYDELLFPYLSGGKNRFAYNRPLTLAEFTYSQRLDTEKFVFQLHGEVTRPETIVLSRESYDNLYESEEYKFLFTSIGAEKVFLFLGHSLTDDYINSLLKVINNYRTNHFVVLPQDEAKEKAEFLKKEYNVTTISYTVESGSNPVIEIRKILNYISNKNEYPEIETIPAEKIKSIKSKPSVATSSIFVGRKDELKLCKKLINGEFKECVLCFFGEKGTGKTRLLKEAESLISDVAFTYSYGSVVKGNIQSFAEFLNDIVDGSQRNIINESIYLTNFVEEHNNIVIFIDEFPYDDSGFISDFNKLIQLIYSKRLSIYFIINSLKEPFWTSDMYGFIKSFKLQEFNKYELSEFIDKNQFQYKDDSFMKWSSSNIDKILLYAQGRPQLFSLVLGSSSTKDIVEKESNKTFSQKVNDVLDNIASNLSQDVSETLDYLSVVSSFEVEWDEDIPEHFFKLSWANIKDVLLCKSLLIVCSKKLKLHDYVSEYYYSKISIIDKATLHNEIAKYYLISNNSQKYMLALSHFIKSFEIEPSRSDLEENFSYIYMKLREIGKYKVLKNLLYSLYKVIKKKSILFSDSLEVQVIQAYASVLLEIGNAKEAIGLFQTLLERLDLNTNEYRNVLVDLSDCYRLTGELQKCIEMCSKAVEICPICINKCESNIEEIITRKCQLAHAYYLFGDFCKSKSQFEEILNIHSKEMVFYYKAYSNFCYRYSKTLRVLDDGNSKYWAEKALQYSGDNMKRKGQSYWALCTVNTLLGDFSQAEEYYRKAKKIFDEIGFRATFFVDYDLAEILKMKGDYLRAKQLYQRLIQQTRDMSEKNRLAFALLGYAESVRSEIQSNDSEKVVRESYTYYREARSIFESMSLKYGVFLCDLGNSLARQDFGDEENNKLRDLLNSAKGIYSREEKIISNIIENNKLEMFPLIII